MQRRDLKLFGDKQDKKDIIKEDSIRANTFNNAVRQKSTIKKQQT